MKLGLINIAFGLLAVAVGLAVSLGSYAAVSDRGGHYVVAWGAVAVGGWRMLIGIFQLVRGAASTEGRAALVRLIVGQSGAGRVTRLSVILVLAIFGYLLAPESWTTISPKPLNVFETAQEVRSLMFSADGRWIAAGLDYGGVMLIDTKTGQSAKLSPGMDIESVAFSPDGKMLAATSYQGVRVWTSSDWARNDPTLLISNNRGDYGLAFSPDGKSFATGSISDGVLLWDIASKSVKWESGTKDTVEGIAFSQDGFLIAAANPYEVKLWDALSGTAVRTLKDDSFLPFTTLAFAKDGRLIGGSYQKPGVVVWGADGSVEKKLRGTASPLWAEGDVWSVATSPDQSWIAAGLSDRSIRLWSMQKDTPTRTIYAHSSDVRAVAFSPDGSRITSAGGTTIKIWTVPAH